MKKFLKAIAWVAGILVLGFGALLTVNAIDEDISPELQKLLVARESSLKEEDNAYFAVWGMAAAENADPHTVGKRAVALLNQRYSTAGSAVEADYAGEIGKLKVSAEIGKLCDWAKQDCYATLSAAVERAAPLAAEHRVLLERYAGLARYKAYRDVGPVDMLAPIPPMQNLTNMATLQLLLAIAEAKRGASAAALDRLASGVGALRVLLGTSENLIGKMIATSMLHRYAIVLAGLANEFPEAFAAERERIAKLLAPLSAGERDVGRALQTEVRIGYAFAKSYLRQPGSAAAFGEPQSGIPDWLRRRFLQVSATMNYRAGIALDEQRLAALPADKLLGEVAGHRRMHEALKESLNGFAWRNPVGRDLVAQTMWDATEYMLRLHDLDAHLRLAALAVEVHARKLAPEAVAGYVNAAGAPALDPYSGKPFQWDAEKRELSTAAQTKSNRYARGGRFVMKI